MSNQKSNNSILSYLVGKELAGVTFVRNYVQLLFDGPIFNLYTLPQIKVTDKIITSEQFGYCDYLCQLINHIVLTAYEDLIAEMIVIKFQNDEEIIISFKEDDKNMADAAILQFENGEWNVW